MTFAFDKRLAFLILTILACFTIHEATHAEINHKYGLDSTFSITTAGLTTIANATQFEQLDAETRLSRLEQQSTVEAIGYQMFIPCLFLALLVVQKFD